LYTSDEINVLAGTYELLLGRFNNNGGGNASGGTYIDGVYLTQVVPEPSTYALILGGIATLLLIRRRVQE
jgi:hypothetical protein